MKKERCEISFKNSDGPLDGTKFGRFLEEFSILHNASAMAIIKNEYFLDDFFKDKERYDNDVTLPSHLLAEISKQYGSESRKSDKENYRELNEYGVDIISMHKNSPLSIVVEAIPFALAAAVIISGGEIQFSPKSLKVKLPPLGTGIKSIRDALNRSP